MDIMDKEYLADIEKSVNSAVNRVGYSLVREHLESILYFLEKKFIGETKW